MGKKRIGILTHYYRSLNLGGLLQAHALTSLLNNKGYDAEQISFEFQTFDKNACRIQKSLGPRKFYLRKIFFYPYYKLKEIWMQYKLRPYLAIQNPLIQAFAQQIRHSNAIYNDETIKQANDRYDVIVVGSDQVWDNNLLAHAAYYGEFTSPDKKVISYAASSNVKKFPPLAEKLFVKKLARLDAISVRENTLKKYVENLTSKPVTLVLDPTLLLSAEEWLKIARPVPGVRKPYIFCYFLGRESFWQRNIVRAYADKYGYDIIHLPYIMQMIRTADWLLKGQGRCDVGPREFISLIQQAECIFTDSFHGMAFSINFKKNFYVFNRDDRTGDNSMNARITDTLEMLGLQDRHITDKQACLDNRAGEEQIHFMAVKCVRG